MTVEGREVTRFKEQREQLDAMYADVRALFQKLKQSQDDVPSLALRRMEANIENRYRAMVKISDELIKWASVFQDREPGETGLQVLERKIEQGRLAQALLDDRQIFSRLEKELETIRTTFGKIEIEGE